MCGIGGIIFLKFNELGLEEDLLKAIKRSGFEEATPIQEATIPLVLAGIDVIGQAQTGTGKTAAFGLPILQHVDVKEEHIQAIVVSPTRELAIQTQEELYRLGKDKRAKVQVVYGGADIRRQIKLLKHVPQILVGTPGRLLDHINRMKPTKCSTWAFWKILKQLSKTFRKKDRRCFFPQRCQRQSAQSAKNSCMNRKLSRSRQKSLRPIWSISISSKRANMKNSIS